MIFQREHKVAVASEDGKRIAAHLGSAPLFIVYTIEKGRITDEEYRVNRRECSRLVEDTHAGCWELMEELLPDVKVVITSGMGENAYVGLLRRNVLPITTDEDGVDNAVQAYMRDRLGDNPRLVHRPRTANQGEGYNKRLKAIKIRIAKGDAENLGGT